MRRVIALVQGGYRVQSMGEAPLFLLDEEDIGMRVVGGGMRVVGGGCGCCGGWWLAVDGLVVGGW